MTMRAERGRSSSSSDSSSDDNDDGIIINTTTAAHRHRRHRRVGCGVKQLCRRLESVLTDVEWRSGVSFTAAMCVVVLAELILGTVIIQRVPYTEIDWVAYMQEVSGFMGGELDYAQLRGDTGPLVYPAGFVYIYSALHYVTGSGANIRAAQYIFLIVYITMLVLVLNVYRRSLRVPPWVLLLVCVSRRIHSIFMLRLFNDGVAMLFLYAAVWLFVRDRWSNGCLLFSLGVSVKMNVLLFAPAVGVLLLRRFGWAGTAPRLLLLCVAPQVLLGLPFLCAYPHSYMQRSFELGRQFMYKWTVNWKCIPESLFLSRQLAIGLLLYHLFYILMFAHHKWCANDGGLWAVLRRWKVETTTAHRPPPSNIAASSIIHTMFTCQFIGIMFCRSLHFQFYTWYFHTLPYMLWQTRLPVIVRLVMLGAVEWVWNVYPATPTTSMTLHVVHACLLLALWFSKNSDEQPPHNKKDKVD